MRLEPPAPRLQAELAHRGIEVGLEQAGRAIKAEIAYYRAHLHEGRDEQSVAALRETCAQVMAAELPPLDDPLAVLMASIEFTAFEDAAPALRELRDRRLRLVVVTNWDISVHEVLDRTGLAPLLDGAVSSAELGRAKPDPAVFEAGLALAGAEPDEALHVGDTVEEDIDGARAAGVRALLIDRETGAGDIGSLAEVPRLLS